MRHAPRVSSRGFTLVELMVSLVAGLIVTIAVVGLAKVATTSFFESARISAVESGVRVASERLRQDLTRAGYMSTGNIRLARDGASGVPFGHKIGLATPTATTGSRYAGLDDLQGIQIIVGGSGTFAITGAGSAGVSNLATNNGLNPDALVLSGNFTTDDSYQGQLVDSGGVQRIELKGDGDSAVRRLIGMATAVNPNALVNLQSAYTPVPGRSYAARIVDGRGCQHYVLIESVSLLGPGQAAVNLVNPAGGFAVPRPGSGNCGANPLEPVTINPVQRVRWYIGANTDAALATDPAIEPNLNKFNLYREFLDAADPPAPIAETRQIIAEYAIDLKFGITVANATNVPTTFDMDSDPGGGAGPLEQWTRRASLSIAGEPGPQRVRSVRFRIATRASLPDRNNSIAVPPGPPYIVRYCINAETNASCTRMARVRTIVSEVALINQLGMTY